MDFFLYRNHYRSGTNGELFHKQQFLSFCIELPWRGNKRSVSCIPDGIYELEPFYSPRFGNHIRIKDVPGRSGILIHAANDAETELRGCIAPVSQLSGIGKGLNSRLALNKVLLRLNAVLEGGGPVFLTISSEHRGF